MGKFSRTWELVKQSFAILRSDKQLMLFPVFSAVACLIVTAIHRHRRRCPPAAGDDFRRGGRGTLQSNQSPVFLLGMFSLYVRQLFCDRVLQRRGSSASPTAV